MRVAVASPLNFIVIPLPPHPPTAARFLLGPPENPFCLPGEEKSIDNEPVLSRVLKLKKEMAGLLGYGSYAEISLSKKVFFRFLWAGIRSLELIEKKKGGW